MDEQQPAPRRDWFKVVAIIALSLGVLAMVGGTVLMAAAFLFVGADVLPPELEPRSGDEFDPESTPSHSPAVRALAIVVVLALILTTVGAVLFTVFRPLPM